MLCAYVFATVRLTRLSRLRRCRLFPCLCVLRCLERSEHSRNHPTARFEKRWLFFACQQFHRTWCSRQESGGSSACGNEIVAKRWCLAFRRSRAKRTPPARHRTSLNRVKCTNANTYHVRTSGIIPPYKKPESKGRLRSPLACLSSISFFTQRKISPPEGPAVPRSIRSVKRLNSKDCAPEGVG